jgi:hypothetical protein
MRMQAKLRPEALVVLGGALLYLVCSFFQWQHFTVTIAVTVRWSFNEWHGIGVIACVLAVLLVVWEVARIVGFPLSWASLSASFVSLALAVLLFLFTVLTFLSRGDGRQWAAWVGLGLSVVIAVAAVVRAKAEDVEMFRLTPRELPAEPAAAAVQPEDEGQAG